MLAVSRLVRARISYRDAFARPMESSLAWRPSSSATMQVVAERTSGRSPASVPYCAAVLVALNSSGGLTRERTFSYQTIREVSRRPRLRGLATASSVDCSGWSCLPRRRTCTRANGQKNCSSEPKADFTMRTIDTIWPHLAAEQRLVAREGPATARAGRRLLLVTTTFPHELQRAKLMHCARLLSTEGRGVLWLVAEDAAAPSPDVSQLLSESGVPHVHLAFGPTRSGGNAQRNVALKYIRDRRLSGVVYNMDDDNAYHPSLWSELRLLGRRRVGIFAVRRSVWLAPACDGYFRGRWTAMTIERPVYNQSTGEFKHFSAGWCSGTKHNWQARMYGARKYCVDMGGFAFDAELLWRVEGEVWSFSRKQGGESELVDKLLGPSGSPAQLQPLANCGMDVLVFHNEYRHFPRPVRFPPARCT